MNNHWHVWQNYLYVKLSQGGTPFLGRQRVSAFMLGLDALHRSCCCGRRVYAMPSRCTKALPFLQMTTAAQPFERSFWLANYASTLAYGYVQTNAHTISQLNGEHGGFAMCLLGRFMRFKHACCVFALESRSTICTKLKRTHIP